MCLTRYQTHLSAPWLALPDDPNNIWAYYPIMWV